MPRQWIWIALGLLAAVSATAGEPLRLATGSAGGTFLPVGHDLAAFWERELGVEVVVDTTAGSIENLRRLAAGEADLAIVGGSPFLEELEGWATRAEDASRLCAMGTLYIDAEQFVIRTDLVVAGNLLDLNGVHMYPGPQQSGGEVDTRTILTALGIEPRYVYAEDRDKGYTAAAGALVSGEFDAATFSGGVPIQAVGELFAAHPGEYTILPFSRHMLQRLRHAHPEFEGVVIDAASYPGQLDPVQAVGGPNLLVAAPHLADALRSQLGRTIRLAISEPGRNLRDPGHHAVLQSLTPELWRQVPVGNPCSPVAGEMSPE